MLNSLCKKIPGRSRGSGRLLGSKLERPRVARQKGDPARYRLGLARELALARNARHIGLHAGDERAERLPNERTHAGRVKFPGAAGPVVRFHALTGPNYQVITHGKSPS